MLKRLTSYFLVVAMALSLIFIFGCPNPDDDNGTVPKPSNLTIVADALGDGVILSWDEVSDVDGYDVITPDGDTLLLNYDDLTYTDDTPASTGTYSVYAVDGDNRSDPATVSDAPYVSSSNVTLYGWNETEPSGFGWTSATGVGETYSVADSTYEAVVDFYFYDLSGFFDFVSGDESPYEGTKHTGIANLQDSNFDIAPESGYYTLQSITPLYYYAFFVEAHYYAKVYVVSTTSTSVTFSYEFQTIANLRIF